VSHQQALTLEKRTGPTPAFDAPPSAHAAKAAVDPHPWNQHMYLPRYSRTRVDFPGLLAQSASSPGSLPSAWTRPEGAKIAGGVVGSSCCLPRLVMLEGWFGVLVFSAPTSPPDYVSNNWDLPVRIAQVVVGGTTIILRKTCSAFSCLCLPGCLLRYLQSQQLECVASWDVESRENRARPERG